ncbi:winged helix-turn-helix domain-containing protein [Natronospira bacteriovora]|uniref:Winged helix-turn-helix domain-containing protein n=1 Tax=Natronospira bacteriovora TaxID=3069753 RepID=A0ABU0W582_9GAMM|nr:winged helix-turn-helix domain-containing protein [Natronospira sp. AB-CW4]MDQ2069068.1 winged helix-turn-helix domain-containing protein [Natronospira sp. AB-CW4]
MGQAGKGIRIGQWRFLPERNLLLRRGERRELEHRLSVLLEHFCSHPSEVLTRDRLLEAVWGPRIVGEESLSVAVSQLRQSLDDTARNPRFIRTVPGVGYQWIATVAREEGPRLRGLWRVAVMTAGLLVSASLLVWWLTGEPEPAAALLEEGGPGSQARQLLASEEPEDWRRAVGLFRAAIDADPDHADAYLGLVEAKLQQLRRSNLPLAPHYGELEALLTRALSLAPSLDRALLLYANLLFLHGRDYPTAEATFLNLLDTHPDHAEGRLAYANFLLAFGRFEEAMAEVTDLRRRQPLFFAVPMVAWNYLMQGETELAWEEIQRITLTEPGSAAYHISAQHIDFQRGDEAAAMQHLLALMERAGFDEERLIRFEADFTHGGLTAVHARLLQERETAALGHYRPPLSWARFALVAGDHGQALDHLEAAREQYQEALLWLAVDPHYRPLHDEPRFQAILGSLGLVLPGN